MTDKKKTSDDDDSFWNINYMLPPKHSLASFSHDTDTVEIEVSPSVKPVDNSSADDAHDKVSSLSKTIPVRRASDLLDSVPFSYTYIPENPLIKQITITEWDSRYTFYKKFRDDALKYFDREGYECQFVPIYLSIPQYSQMNPEQFRYYFWWRSNIRKGVYPETAYSYILLYVYEILNLPEKITPQKGLLMLADIWNAYRSNFWKLDMYIPEWMCDYCCIHKLSPPYEYLGNLRMIIFNFASFKEFFIEPRTDRNEMYYLALLETCSDVNWRKSKFYTEETSDFFERHMKAAFIYTAQRLAPINKHFIPFGDNTLYTTVTRTSYIEALCVYDNKRKITAEYYAVSRSPELRQTVGNIIKLIENNIRMLLGIKSRYQTSGVDENVKRIVSEYFAPFKIADKKASKNTQPEPEYMKQYEASSSGITVENAKNIEQSSWEITEKLVGAFDDTEASETESSETELSAGSNTAVGDVPPDTNDEKVTPVDKALVCLFRGDMSGFRSAAEENNMLPDSLCELINETLYDIIGDICIENAEIIEDYLPDIENYLKEKGVLNE